MTNKRGGQRKHWAEKARVWTWYSLITEACNWEDAELDHEFAWTEKGKSERDEQKRRGETPDSPRSFERIGAEARQPQGSGIRWRGMPELVVAVDEHYLFKGTKALYDAILWKMFQETSVTHDVLTTRINLILGEYDLVRVPFHEVAANPMEFFEGKSIASIFDDCLRISLNEIDTPWSRLELVWCLYIQNEPVRNAEIRKLLESKADHLLGMFFYEYNLDRHFDFYHDAMKALSSTRLDLSSIGNGYGNLEFEGEKVVLPVRLVGKLEEKHISWI